MGEDEKARAVRDGPAGNMLYVGRIKLGGILRFGDYRRYHKQRCSHSRSQRRARGEGQERAGLGIELLLDRVPRYRAKYMILSFPVVPTPLDVSVKRSCFQSHEKRVHAYNNIQCESPIKTASPPPTTPFFWVMHASSSLAVRVFLDYRKECHRFHRVGGSLQ